MISLCMIVRNEESCLERCLENITWPVTEIIIVDTGSQDRTIEIASKYTTKIYFKEYQGDYSELRNYSMSLASNPWILVLDADEIISRDDVGRLCSVIHEMETQKAYAARLWRYDYYKNGGWVIRSISRLFKNDAQIFYQRIVNETASFSVKKKNPQMVYSPIIIHHYGFLKDDLYVGMKHDRYRELLQKGIEENDDSLIYYYAKENYLIGNLEEAELLCEETLLCKPKKRLLNLLGDIWLEKKNSRIARTFYSQVIHWENEEEKTIGSYPTKFFLHATNRMAEIAYVEKDYMGSEKMLTDLIKRTDVNCSAHLYINLALVHLKMGQKKKAIQEFLEAIKINPQITYIQKTQDIGGHYTDTFADYCGVFLHLKGL